MTDMPKCASWLGHKYEGRFTLEPASREMPGDMWALFPKEAKGASEASRRRLYERDICVRCGHVIERRTV